jgi:alkanesulfonate monooxygenase SsuD/methylene tetrahydromethanopterin reductase-like flavin-dependent oxidoreductase (luciferase family)
MMEAIRVYRERFQPSAQLDRPYVMLGFNAFAAASAEEAELLSTSVQQAFVNLRSGRARSCRRPCRASLSPTAGGAGDAPPGPHLLGVGDAATVAERIEAFVERTGADELMITSQIFDHEARLRSYEIVAEAMG